MGVGRKGEGRKGGKEDLDWICSHPCKAIMVAFKSVLLASLVVIAAVVLGIGHESQYVFDPETMHKVAKQALSENKADDAQVSGVRDY